MTHDQHCESCGMPIESGHYCAYCTDADGNLQAFDERFERMIGWQARKNPAAPRAQLEAETLEHMATLPAWKDHPRVVGRTV
ncbi:MAG: zinc ribbon domain-containing protein [Brevundimonas sp.]